MDGEALKGCPFCGYVPAQANVSGGGPKYWVECYKCEASGPVTDGWANVAREWNHRPGEAAGRSLGYVRAQADERAERDAATARAVAAEKRAEALAAEVAQARAEGAAAERAKIAAYLRLAAEAHCDPAMYAEADCIESGEYTDAVAQPAGEVSDG